MDKIIKINDWTLTRTEEVKEPLVADLELATRLGYERPSNVRNLIRRMIKAGQLGERCFTVKQRPETGGKEVDAYFLTESQSLKVIARSKTELADKILDEIIAVYMAWRRGELEKTKPGPKPIYGKRSLLGTRVTPEEGAAFGELCRVNGLSQTEGLGQLVRRELAMPESERTAATIAATIKALLPYLNQQPAPQELPDDPGFPEPSRAPRPKQRPLALIQGRPPAQDISRWYWLAEIANTLKLSIQQVRHIVNIHGVPTRQQRTKNNNLAQQTTEQGRREIERHAQAMGLLMP